MSVDADLSVAAEQHLVQRPMALELDQSRYIGLLDEFEATDAQKSELLMTLWSIMRSFVELGISADLSAAKLREVGLLPRETANKEGHDE